jgi:Phage terminase large subunit (GpA).
MAVERILKLKPSQLAKAILQLKGKPLDLEEYKPFELIYDISPPEMTLMAGRQIGKSVSLGGNITSNSIIRSFFSTLFISPLAQQTSRFSTQYLDPFLNSPIVKKHFIDSSSRKNIFEKSLNNGSRIFLGYADTEQDADRIRGISADALFNDEIQDQSLEAGPILAETLSASDYGFIRNTGTAKTSNNTLTIKFERSNMSEWVIKCEHCNRYTIPNTFEACLKMTDNPEGPGCVYCGKLLNVKNGTWMAGRPSEKDHLGFHLPQVIIPARSRPKQWKDIQTKVKTYNQTKLANEVFGVPSGLSGRILSLKEAMACCNPSRREFDKGFPMDDRNIICTFLGCDWSVSGSTDSYTVFSVLGYDSLGKCYLLYAERLDGIDILEQVERAKYLFRQYKCSMLGSDRGVGVLQGQIFQRDLGADRAHLVQYVAAKHALRFDKAGGFFSADRTQNMDTMIIKSKMGISKFETPCWEIMADFWKDALSVTEEITLSGRRVYRKDEGTCDDWLHSIVFANVAYMIQCGKFIYVDEAAAADDASAFEF